eukprot:GILJ01008033.1.p1 GENE.GILJ01008033.1~~GILJ01008033.1.p1  ORF type:complete len:374 (+),score=49.15 GILJ01008033.1:100-1122(+)
MAWIQDDRTQSGSTLPLIVSGSADQIDGNKITLWRPTGVGHGHMYDMQEDFPDLVNLAEWTPPDSITDLKRVQAAPGDSIKIMSSCLSGEMSLLEATVQQQSYKWKELSRWQLHQDACISVDVNTGSNEAVSIGEDGILNVVDIGSGTSKAKRRIVTGEGAPLRAVRYLQPNIVATLSTHLKLWNISSSSTRPVKTLCLDETPTWLLHCVAPHPSRPEKLATGSASGELSIWDLRHNNFPLNRTSGHQADVWDVQFNPSAPHILMTAGNEGWIQKWNFDSSNTAELSQTQVEYLNDEEHLQLTRELECNLSVNSLDIDLSTNATVCGTDAGSVTVMIPSV